MRQAPQQLRPYAAMINSKGRRPTDGFASSAVPWPPGGSYRPRRSGSQVRPGTVLFAGPLAHSQEMLSNGECARGDVHAIGAYRSPIGPLTRPLHTIAAGDYSTGYGLGLDDVERELLGDPIGSCAGPCCVF